jgi:aldehyde dehydrogenase (NAD+)
MQDVLQQLGIQENHSGTSTGQHWIESKGKIITSFSPVNGKKIASVQASTDEAYDQAIKKAGEAFMEWRMWPSPKRGE